MAGGARRGSGGGLKYPPLAASRSPPADLRGHFGAAHVSDECISDRGKRGNSRNRGFPRIFRGFSDRGNSGWKYRGKRGNRGNSTTGAFPRNFPEFPRSAWANFPAPKKCRFHGRNEVFGNFPAFPGRKPALRSHESRADDEMMPAAAGRAPGDTPPSTASAGGRRPRLALRLRP